MLTQTKTLALYVVTVPLAITSFAVLHLVGATAKAYSFVADRLKYATTIDDTPDVFIHPQYHKAPEYFDRPLTRQDNLKERTPTSRFSLDSIEF